MRESTRIFSNVVQAKTEEELGNACLSVALEVTGSEFGFINEMGADGLLHDVAKSELGMGTVPYVRQNRASSSPSEFCCPRLVWQCHYQREKLLYQRSTVTPRQYRLAGRPSASHVISWRAPCPGRENDWA